MSQFAAILSVVYYIYIYIFIYSTLDIFTMLSLGTRVVIATGPGLACVPVQGFYGYLYSNGAYPTRLEQLLNISWRCVEPLVSFMANFTPSYQELLQ